MQGAPLHCWACLAGVSGGEKTYLGSCIIINIYPTLSATIGGRDGVDGSGALWMTHSNYRTRHQSWLLGALPRCWAHLAGVSGREKMYLGCSIIIKIYHALSLAIGGRDRVDGSGGHWMTHSNYRTRHQSWLLGALPRCWVHLAGVLGGVNVFRIYYTSNNLLYHLIS
jgi:hypothetical protein